MIFIEFFHIFLTIFEKLCKWGLNNLRRKLKENNYARNKWKNVKWMKMDCTQVRHPLHHQRHRAATERRRRPAAAEVAEAADPAATAATAAKANPSITRATSSDSPAPWNAAVPTARISITGTGKTPPFSFSFIYFVIYSTKNPEKNTKIVFKYFLKNVIIYLDERQVFLYFSVFLEIFLTICRNLIWFIWRKLSQKNI